MQKLAVLTINDNYNLGNRFQNYATQEIFKKHTIKVETILSKKVYYKSKIKKIIKMLLIIKLKYKRYNNFMKFNKNIKYSKYQIDINHIPNKLATEYNQYITGSDQVWNPNFNRMSDIDFLKFAPKEKKVLLVQVLELARYQKT